MQTSTDDDSWTVEALVTDATHRLADAGVEAPRQEACLLLSRTGNLDLIIIHAFPETRVDHVQRDHFEELLVQRIRRRPFAQITGTKEFRSLDFVVSRDVIVPRPETEAIVDFCERHFGSRGPRSILDIGTGSGCILISLLKLWPDSRGVGVDRHMPALHIAAQNASNLHALSRADFVCSDWLDGIAGEYDLIVSNPPYVASDDLCRLAPEITDWEPVIALDGGHDGLDCYRKILPGLRSLLARDAVAVFELGAGQADAVRSIADDSGLAVVATIADISGMDRCLVLANSMRESDMC